MRHWSSKRNSKRKLNFVLANANDMLRSPWWTHDAKGLAQSTFKRFRKISKNSKKIRHGISETLCCANKAERNFLATPGRGIDHFLSVSMTLPSASVGFFFSSGQFSSKDQANPANCRLDRDCKDLGATNTNRFTPVAHVSMFHLPYVLCGFHNLSLQPEAPKGFEDVWRGLKLFAFDTPIPPGPQHPPRMRLTFQIWFPSALRNPHSFWFNLDQFGSTISKYECAT